MLVLGACSATPPKVPPPIECVPVIEVVTRYVPLDAWLTERHSNPPIPSNGDNAALLEWCITCAGNTRMLNAQMDAIEETGRE